MHGVQFSRMNAIDLFAGLGGFSEGAEAAGCRVVWAANDRMRMLSVTEARRAMGFRDTYLLPENKRLAMHMLGNAVCPPAATDIINALREAA